MKKMIAVAGLAVLSTSAFATKARMSALGQDANQGSFFMRDNRTMFRNAAHINDQKDFITVELGTDSTLGTDTQAAPHAEGGFVKDSGAFVYGVHLGFQRSNDDDNAYQGNVDTTTANDFDAGDYAFLGEDNRVDIFFGGDAGIQWGVNVHYANNSEEGTTTIDTATNFSAATAATLANSDEASFTAMGVNAGIVMGDIEAWANIEISEESEGGYVGTAAATNEFRKGATAEGDLGLQIGASYSFGNYVAYGEYDMDGTEINTVGAAATREHETSNLVLGVAEMMEVNEKARWFWDARYQMNSVERTVGSTTTEVNDNDLRVTVGFEADVKEWLTLRGHVAQDVLLSEQENVTTATTTVTDNNSTSVAGGATLRWGDVSIDGVLGAANVGQLGSDGDHFFSRASFVYNF